MERGIIGKYETRAILGSGAMGTVFDGWDPFIARRVAIKTIAIPDVSTVEGQDQLHRFRREAQIAGRLSHPRIIAVHDYGEADGFAYIVMEFVDGKDLVTFLADKRARGAGVTEAVRLVRDVLAGLDYSHEYGVVHRDIKPANILVTEAGQVKIGDFGIARVESSSLTLAGTMIGTLAYMSPEQLIGQTVDARSDLYSVGVLLYQLLTGERPFEGSMTSIMHKALNTRPPRPSELALNVPPALDAVVERAMARRPDDRFRTAMEFSEALYTALPGETMRAEDRSQPPPVDATIFGRVPPRAPVVPADLPPSIAAGSTSGRNAAPRGRRKMMIVACATLVAAFAFAGSALLFTLGRPPTSQSALAPPVAILAPGPPLAGSTLVDAIVALLPPGTRERAREDVEGYAKTKSVHRSIAMTSEGWTWWSGPLGTQHEAEDIALEACTVFSGHPCATLAIDGMVVRDSPVVRAMPNVSYSGTFEPRMIPTLQSVRRDERDVSEYLVAPEFKAMALHPWGRVFTSTASTSQQVANDAVLRACGEDPARRGRAGSCYLYAEGINVVLPRRTAGLGVPFAVPQGPDEMLERLLGTFPQANRGDVREFLKRPLNRVFAFSPGTGRTYYWWNRPVVAGLESGALEACVLNAQAPCRVAMINNAIIPAADAIVTSPPRVAYAGPFDPLKIPALELYVRGSAVVAEYASAAGAKAMAIHLSGFAYTGIGKPSQAEADAAALDACILDHQTGEGGPCYLYASADRVVLGERRTKGPK